MNIQSTSLCQHPEYSNIMNAWVPIGPKSEQGLSRAYKSDSMKYCLMIAEKSLGIIDSCGQNKTSVISMDGHFCTIGLHVAVPGEPTEKDYALAEKIDKAILDE